MKFKIEITNNHEELIEEMFFNTLKELQHYYYSIDRNINLQIKYRSYILRSYIYYETDEEPYQEEIREYFKIFPDNPNKYNYSGSVISNMNFKNNINNNEKIVNILKILCTIVVCILFFPIIIIIGAIKNK